MKKILFILSILLLTNATSLAIEEYTTTYVENNKFGLIKNETIITKPIYSKLIRLRDSSWLFLYKNKYGFMNNEGEILVEPKFKQAERFVGKYAKLGLNGKYSLYNENGKLIIPHEYTSINLLYGKMFLVEKNYKYGLINFNGDIILAPIADDIYMPKPNILKIQYENNWYEISQVKGEELEIPSDISLAENNENMVIKQIINNPITTTSLGMISASDYFIKLFSSISPAYEQTIDELIFNHGADTATILIKSSWLVKFPFVYGKNYIKNIKSPNNGPLSDVKSNLKNKLK